MKSKQYLLVVLSVLILLLFITSASAAEINETDGVSIDEQVNLENNLLSVDNNVKCNEISNDTLKESNSELLTAGNDWYVNSSKTSSGDGKSEADAFKTLNEALTNNELQDYDTIMIASGEYKGINDNIGLTIVKNLNFIKYGDGEAIFDAEGLSRILTVNSTSVNITGLTFKNGNSTDGGAIFISHEIDESNIKATFINNTAVEKGGAIYIVSGGISGNLNSIFINNTASSWGGAIYIDSGGISGNVNGTFINNKGSSGSAIFIAGDISGNVNGTFINNEAKGLGAIYIYNGDASGNVKGTFINNIANRGGAIAVGDDGTVSGNIKGTFINNTGYYAGGAICIANSERYPTGNLEGIFINNKAESGGAIYIEFSYENPVVSLGGTFINNNASSGGAIHINQMFAPVTIQDSIFLNNSDALSFGLGDYIKTVDCWFGNNATNYNVMPDAGKAVMDRWLFLNATANPADVSIDENSIIAFKLDSYDNSSGKVKPYDASKMNIILDLTQTLGDLDKTAASIDENITYTARQGGNSCITGKYETVSYTIELNNVKLPTEINVINSTIALKANEEVDAGATLSPTEAGNLTYTSNNTDVVIVENGKIKSIKKGNATITVSFAGDERYAPADNKTISVSVSLIDTSVAAENMTLNVGESGIINYTVTPEELKVNFVADNSGVVSVDEDGTVKALKNGTANITINVGDDEVYAKNSAVITVTVNLNDASVVAEDMELNVSESGVINYTVNPEGLNVTFVVDNSGIVSVDENGTVKALKEGKTNVTLKVGDGKVYVENSTIITITVSRISTMIAVNDTTFYLDVGDEVDPGVSLIPSDAGELDYVSSDENVVVVNGDGTFTAVGNGTANITVSFSGNEKFEPAESKIIDVTVSKIPTEIFVRNATVDMNVGDEVDPGVRISPSDAGELDYVSSDVSVVRVDGNGTFVAVGDGSANVTVSFSGNAKFEPAESKIITVAVSKIPTEIFVRNATVDMNVGDEVDPGVRISPSDAGELDYVSSDVSVVRVDGDGTFVAVGDGSANVTVSFSGNAKFEPAESKIITVAVSKIPTEIFVRNATVDMNVGDEVDPGVRISPSDAGELDYVSSDVSVVRVDGDGTFVAVGNGSANVTVSFSGNAKFEPAESKIITVTVSKIPTEIFVRNSTIDLSVDDNATISYKLIPKDAEGDVRFMSNDTSIVYADAETGIIVGRGVGTATVSVTYFGNGKYKSSATNVTVTVSKIPTRISAEGCELFVDDNATISYELIPEDAAGDVRFMSNDSSVVYADAETGVVVGRGVGTATVSVTYFGNGKYKSSATNVTVTVRKLPTRISAEGCELFVDDNATISYELIPEDAAGDVRFMSNDSSVVYADAETGVVVGRGAGTATVSVTYFGDDKYESSSTNVTVTVRKLPTRISAEGCELFVDDNATISYELIPKDAEGDVRFMSNDTSIVYVDAETGVVVGRGAGTATVSVTYFGDDKYESSSTNVTVTVRKLPTRISAEGCELFVDDNATISYELIPKDAEGDVRFMSNDTSIVYVDAETGVVVGRGAGTATVSVSYFGNDKYAPSNTTVKVVVNKLTTNLVTKYENGTIYATVTDAKGNPVSGLKVGFAVKGVKYVISDENGQANYTLPDLDAGTYRFKVMAYGNDLYENSNTETVVVVKKQSKIFLRNALYFTLETKIVKITLWDDNNKPVAGKTVHLKVYDSRYSGVTDKDGNAYIRVGIGFGVHKATVSFDGDYQYASSNRTGEIRVIKETPSIMVRGADQKFKVGDNPKVVNVYLWDRNSKPLPVNSKVAIKVNGQTFVGYTDSRGIAKVVININKPGIFQAELRYAGNSAYNAVTRPIKFTIS